MRASEAIEDAYRRHAGELMRFATVLVGPDDAADVVSEALTSALRRGTSDVDNVRAWLFRIVHRRAVDHLRSASRRRSRDGAHHRRRLPAPDDDPAAAVAAFPGEPQELAPARGGHRRWVALATLGTTAVIVAAAVMVALLVVVAPGDDPQVSPVGPSAVATAPTPTVPTTAGNDRTPAPTTGEAPPTDPATSAGPIAPTSLSPENPRPLLAPERCTPLYAREGTTDGLVLFSRPSTNPVPIQVVAGPDAEAGPFALVLRYFGDDRTPATLDPRSEEVIVGDQVFVVATYPNGNGWVDWLVGDGSLGSLRARGLDRDQLLAIAAALVPRPTEAGFAGFDVPSTIDGAPGMQLRHEALDSEVKGEIGGSACEDSSTGAWYRVSAIAGDPVFRYGGVIDRLVPLAVGVRGDVVIVIDGAGDRPVPDVADVVAADPDTWLGLLAQPDNPFDDVRTEPVGIGRDVVAALRPAVDEVDGGYVRFAIEETEGVYFLEVSQADATYHPDAAFERTTVDGRTRSITTAHAGSVSGTRLGDLTPGQRIDVEFTVVDGGGFVLQTTGTITLVPQF